MYPRVPILGLTATATPKMVEELQAKLGLRHTLTFSISFNRKNLFYDVVPLKRKDRKNAIVSRLQTKYKNLSGIIYTATIKQCEELWTSLKFTHGIKCALYHGKLEIEKRNEIQKKWKNNEVDVIVATIAFGMGVDKKDVRFVIHMTLPKSLDGYIQVSFDRCIIWFRNVEELGGMVMRVRFWCSMIIQIEVP